MASTGRKNNWALFLLLLAGIVLGSFLGNLAKDISFLSWLNYGKSFGLKQPIVLDVGVMVLTFGLSVYINMASIIGVIIAIFVYRKA